VLFVELAQGAGEKLGLRQRKTGLCQKPQWVVTEHRAGMISFGHAFTPWESAIVSYADRQRQASGLARGG
jgi:hypothetical protein